MIITLLSFFMSTILFYFIIHEKNEIKRFFLYTVKKKILIVLTFYKSESRERMCLRNHRIIFSHGIFSLLLL